MSCTESVEQLVDQLSSRNAGDRIKARSQLVKLNHVDVVSAVADKYHSRQTQLRWEVVSTLAQMRRQSAIPGLIKALEDEDADIRQIAARGLAEQGQAGLIAIATAMEQGRHTTSFYNAARFALSAMRTSSPSPDREHIAILMSAAAGPEPGVTAPVAAYTLLHR